MSDLKASAVSATAKNLSQSQLPKAKPAPKPSTPGGSLPKVVMGVAISGLYTSGNTTVKVKGMARDARSGEIIVIFENVNDGEGGLDQALSVKDFLGTSQDGSPAFLLYGFA